MSQFFNDMSWEIATGFPYTRTALASRPHAVTRGICISYATGIGLEGTPIGEAMDTASPWMRPIVAATVGTVHYLLHTGEEDKMNEMKHNFSPRHVKNVQNRQSQNFFTGANIVTGFCAVLAKHVDVPEEIGLLALFGATALTMRKAFVNGYAPLKPLVNKGIYDMLATVFPKKKENNPKL